MATQSPFSFLGGVFERIAAGPQPPQWLVHEVQHRVVLLLNHVLMQENVAMQRLQPRRGRVVTVSSVREALEVIGIGVTGWVS